MDASCLVNVLPIVDVARTAALANTCKRPLLGSVS
jgi:hypothetical protein